jgi:hypothetical protein
MKGTAPSESRLREIVSEVHRKGYFGRLFARAARRKSRWNLLLIPIALCSIVFVAWLSLRLVWVLRNFIVSDRAVPFSTLIRQQSSGLAPLLFFIPPLFASIPIGLFVTNAIVWCIAPARRALDREATGVWHASFTDAQKDLGLMTLCISCPALAISLIGALLLRA